MRFMTVMRLHVGNSLQPSNDPTDNGDRRDYLQFLRDSSHPLRMVCLLRVRFRLRQTRKLHIAAMKIGKAPDGSLRALAICRRDARA